MSGFSSLIDEDGNINSSKLAKELKGALEFDMKYKQTDNMKKRAIRSAASYDEFRAMVQCAHLKKLSKKEVESLSHVKKGWQKSSVAAEKASKSSILNLELEQEQLENLNLNEQVAKLVNKDKKARTCMELERDIRRLPSDIEKYRYLSELGVKSSIHLLKKGADVDMIEEIIRIVMEVCPNEVGQLSVADDETEIKQQLPPLLTWITKLSVVDKFDLMLRFASKDLIDRVKMYVANQPLATIALRNKLGLNE